MFYLQTSIRFFMIMLVTFLDRTAPASKQANPACITETNYFYELPFLFTLKTTIVVISYLRSTIMPFARRKKPSIFSLRYSCFEALTDEVFHDGVSWMGIVVG